MMINSWISHITTRQRLGLGGAALLAIGLAGGAGAVSLTHPTVEMAPTVPTPVAKLAATHGIVTVRGRVAESYGDHFIVQDATGRVLVDAGRGGAAAPSAGDSILVQGRFDDGQLRARFLVDAAGDVAEVGPRPPLGHRPHPDRDGPPPPPPGRDGSPPPPPGIVPPPPPPGAGAPQPLVHGPGTPGIGAPPAPTASGPATPPDAQRAVPAPPRSGQDGH